MKLKDYLKEFEGMDPEAEMVFQMTVGCCGDTEDLLDPWVDANQFKFQKQDHSIVRVLYTGPEFLNSCRKYGAARNTNG